MYCSIEQAVTPRQRLNNARQAGLLFVSLYLMKQQHYANHKRYYFPHHFILLPLLGFLMVFGVRNGVTDKEHSLVWWLFAITMFCILYLAIMLRQHYALGNQNRIVRLEFSLRYFELFGKRSEEVLQQLSFGQVAALRFAPDDEFVHLLKRALEEQLSGDEIKKAIKNWKPDHNRV